MNIHVKYRLLFEHYFLITCISSIVLLFFNKGYIESILFPLIIYITAFYKKNNSLTLNIQDVLVILLFSWIVFTWSINSYEYKLILIIKCIFGQIAYMSAYYIGRKYPKSIIDNLLNNTLTPLAICCIIGIYWYFFPPNWYLNNTLKTIEYFGGMNDLGTILELSRLRSIFGSPYNIAYMCTICITYLFTKLYKFKEKYKKYYIFILIYTIAMLFCMMRAPIVCVIFFFLIFQVYSFKYRGEFLRFIKIIVLTLLIVLTITLILNTLDPTILEFIEIKFLSVVNPDELINDRLNLYSSFNYSYNLIGDGVGRHAFYVNTFTPQKAISDGEYTKIIVEQGYIGLTIYILFLLALIIKCLIHFKYLIFELCIILFYAITMIGANPLSTPDKYCFIFWLIAGYISSFNPRKQLNISKIRS